MFCIGWGCHLLQSRPPTHLSRCGAPCLPPLWPRRRDLAPGSTGLVRPLHNPPDFLTTTRLPAPPHPNVIQACPKDGPLAGFRRGGIYFVVIFTDIFRSSTMHFHVVVKALMTSMLSMHHCTIPFVVAHHAPKQPLILNMRRNWEYIQRKAYNTPSWIPCSSITAMDMVSNGNIWYSMCLPALAGCPVPTPASLGGSTL